MKRETKPVEPVIPPKDLEPQKPAEPEPQKPAEPEPQKPAEPEPQKPAEPEPQKPAESEPKIISPDNLLSSDSVSTDETKTTIADPESLIDGSQDFNSLPPSLPAQPTLNTSTEGCQCLKCKAAPERRDKRGRHHKSCPCPTCQPTASFADITAPAAATNYQAMSEMTFDMSTGVLTMVFGDEWKPRDTQERTAVVTCLKTYLESKQVKDIPPGLMLTVVAIAYAAPRFRSPSTKQKISAAWTWCKSKLSNLRKKK